MYFDFCINDTTPNAPSPAVATIFHLHGDPTYDVPRKAVSEGRFYFSYTTAGEGALLCDGRPFSVRSGDFLFLEPHKDFSYRCAGACWHFWWFEGYALPSGAQADMPQSAGVSKYVTDTFAQSLLCAKSGSWALAAELFSCGAHVLQQSAFTAGDKWQEVYRTADQYIRENLPTVTVAQLAAELGHSERHLRYLFADASDYSPKQLIVKIRLEAAQQLLQNSTLSLTAVAEQTGFSSSFHLCNSFKDMYGLSPSRYRTFFRRG